MPHGLDILQTFHVMGKGFMGSQKTFLGYTYHLHSYIYAKHVWQVETHRLRLEHSGESERKNTLIQQGTLSIFASHYSTIII